MENELFKYEVNQDNEVCILGCKQTGINELPESINGCPVTSISMGVIQSYDEKNRYTKVVIPASVKEIRPLKDEKLFDTFNRVEVEVSSDNKHFICKDGILYNKDMTELIYCPSKKINESGIFNVPNTVEVIKKGAFRDSRFTEINLPNGLKSIEALAFDNSKKLTEMYIPDSVVEMGYAAFAACESMQRVHLSNSLSEIPKEAFWGCKSMKFIDIPSSVESINQHAFSYCTNLVNINDLENVRTVGEGAFEECTALQGIGFGIDTKIESFALNKCDSLQKVKLPPSYDTQKKQAEIFAYTKADNIEISFAMENEKLMRNNYLIGMGYLYGRGVEKDVDRGLAFIEAASQLGYVEATKKLSDIYEYGIGVDTDHAKAKEYRDKAREQAEKQKYGIGKNCNDSSIVSSYVGTRSASTSKVQQEPVINGNKKRTI